MGDRTRTHHPQPPQFLQRSRSSSAAPRHCHACTSGTAPDPTPPFSPINLPLSRSKSASKARTSSASSSKENRNFSPSPRTLNTSALLISKKPSSPGMVRPYPSAWAMSPGRSPEPLRMETEKKKKKDKGMMSGSGVMGFLIRRRREPPAKEEEVHQLRMMGCRLLQWRFVNARRERAMARVRSSAERKLFFAWLRINELRNIVAAKRILIQRRKHKLKLARVLNPQLHFLNKWEPLSKRHLESLTGLSRVLEAVCLPLPLIDGAQANLVLLHNYISMSMEIMVEIEAAVRIFYSKVEEASMILVELVEIVGLEMEGLKELIKTSEKITTLEMHETSLRANLIQATKKEVDPPPLSTLRLQSWMQSHQWPIY